MRILISATVAVVVMVAAATAIAQTQRPSVITNPDWLTQPDAADMAKAYPLAGAILAINGHAVIACEISSQGEAQDCQVVSETPAGLGFGHAALTISKVFRFSPKTIDGRPVGGATVRVPLAFVYPANDGLAAGKGYTPSAVSDRQRDLAERMFEQVGGPSSVSEGLRQFVIDGFARTKSELPPGLDNAVSQEAIADVETAVLVRIPEISDAFLREFAASNTEQDLDSALSDPAKAAALVGAFFERLDAGNPPRFLQAGFLKARDDARVQFCSHRAC